METQSAPQRMVKDVKNDDLRIQVTGRIKETPKDGKFTLEDSTGKITINYVPEDYNLKKGDVVNAIGELQVTVSGEKILYASIIQDMNNLNLKYYEELYKLKKEILG